MEELPELWVRKVGDHQGLHSPSTLIVWIGPESMCPRWSATSVSPVPLAHTSPGHSKVALVQRILQLQHVTNVARTQCILEHPGSEFIRTFWTTVSLDPPALPRCPHAESTAGHHSLHLLQFFCQNTLFVGNLGTVLAHAPFRIWPTH